jgi:general secretion pathway protein L
MRRMFRELLKWWIGNLADLIPAEWRRSGSPAGDALVVAPAGPLEGGVETAQVTLRQNGRETALGQFGLTSRDLAGLPRPVGKPVVLRLAETDVLSTMVTLPLSAEPDLDNVLAFEIDRETPFRPEEIFWSHRIVRRDRERGQLLVRLMLVPRATLDGLLGVLTAAGITPERAEIGDGPDRGCYLVLDGGRLKEPPRLRLLRWPAAACCAALGAAVILVPFVRQNSALAELDREIAAGQQARAEAEKLREEIARLSDTLNLIDSERDKAGRPLATLAALTRLLPEDTYLIEYRQQQQVVTLAGRSASTSRLITALAASEQLHNPTFAAPVTRTDSSNAEVFVIRAEVGL